MIINNPTYKVSNNFAKDYEDQLLKSICSLSDSKQHINFESFKNFISDQSKI